MFIILTHDNQSTLSSFVLFLSFLTNNSVAEKSLFDSTDVGLIVIKAWYGFSIDLFLASKRLIITICDRISSCSRIVCGLHSKITWIMCFYFKWLIKLLVLEPPPFV